MTGPNNIIANSRWFANLNAENNRIKKAVEKTGVAFFPMPLKHVNLPSAMEVMRDPLSAVFPERAARMREAQKRNAQRTEENKSKDSPTTEKAEKSDKDSSRESSTSDSLKDLLPLLALGGGGGLGIWGLYDLFSEKKSKTSGIIKTLLGLLLAGAALYPMLTGKSLTDLLPGQNEPSKSNPSSKK